MDDSDQDFVDLCSKLLKRVRKKPDESRPPSDGDKRRRNHRRGGHGDPGSARAAGTQPVRTGADEPLVSGGSEHDAGDAEASAVSSVAAAAGPRGSETRDKVLHRMQQFKRAEPQRMLRRDEGPPANHEDDGPPPPPPPLPPPLTQRLVPDTPHSGSGLQPDSDEALAQRLQQELDREAAEAQTADLQDRGLFFCQICQRDLSRMTPEGRTQHLNRCLDESEGSAPAPPPPPPGVPDCPICGKKFKSQKSRSTHLKRCSSDMGVAPAVLLQALQRQTEETQDVPTDHTLTQAGGTKRKGPSKPGLPARKKPRKKTAPLDEETMVALALSSSLLEQEQRGKRESETQPQTNAAASHIAMTSALKSGPDTVPGAGKRRRKRKNGAVPRPPPLLLVQDAEAALTRLQERVSALLLRSRAPSPPTPTRCPSSLPGWSGAAVLWQKSTLLDGASTGRSDFYTPELREFITPWESATTDAASSSTTNKPQSSVQPVSVGTPGPETRASILPSSSQMSSSSRALLMDLMELAEDGVTLTQCGRSASGPDKDKSASQIRNIRLSGFVPEESEEQADLCVSGFLPEPTHTHSEDVRCRARRTTAQPGANERGSHQSVALSRLASDLSSLVNNPQLSDLQLQVDSGEIYFAHSFMLYARCPLLAEMVHESGFGVQEEGGPAVQRVLMNDVPGQAVLALLQYLYTARCSIPASLRAHVLELASRFDLQELQSLCQRHQQDPETLGDKEDHVNQEENVSDQTNQAFAELLRSMWDGEDEDDEGPDADGGRDEGRESEDHQADDLASGDREIREENVNEEELEEIYEFAATQRKREEEKDSTEEEGKVDEEEDGEEVLTKPTEPKGSPSGLGVKQLQPNSQLEPDPGLDRSYSRLFSDSWGVYEEADPSSLPSTSAPATTHTPQYQQRQSPHNPSPEPSLLRSSASVVDDLSLSPPPNASNLPIPGQSPGQVGDWGGGGDEGTEDLALKRESPGPRSICELIVLSDSSEEMEVVLSSRSPSPHPSCAVQKPQSYTQLKPQPVPKPNEPVPQIKRSNSFEFSPDDPSAAPVQSHVGPWCEQDPADCSPEVSWLIPSTPVQPAGSTTTSSTQTKSSMCRTQLFPKGDTSSHSVFSSPALPFSNRVQTSNSPVRVSAHVGPTEGSVPKLELDETWSSSLNSNFSSQRPSSRGVSKGRGACGLPPSQPKLSSSASSKQDTPLHVQPQPYSSTPLHTEHKAPAVLATSLFHSDLDKSWTSLGKDRAPSESPEKMELGSFHLSPLSDPSHPSSSSDRGLQGESSRQSHRSAESSSHDNTGSELKGRGLGHDKGERERGGGNKDTGDEEEQEEAGNGEADVAESSFQQSFVAMDEPPMAFSDSWGFDAVDLEANPGCFSLRLEDSGGSSQQGERGPGRRDAAGSSSSTDHRPSPGSHSGHLLNSRVTASPPSKAHSSPPSTSVAAHMGLSFTPSPPDPTNQTTPEIINSLLDSKIWDSWEEDEEPPPLSHRVNPSAQLKTPASSHNARRRTLVPITPLPHYSDMDTPELKNKLNRFGVRPLPKRQMILKLKEIHQYTHQLVSSEEEEEEAAPSASSTVQTKRPTAGSDVPGNRPVSCTQRVKFKEPRAAISPLKPNRQGEEEEEPLSASQGSNTSSTAASEESESRSNPELCLSSDSDSDGGISASQTANRLQDLLRAVRSFILSDSKLYSQILQYQPLVLSQLQERLKAAGIRLGAAKLVDYLDSQCITFTTAKPGSAPGRRRVKRTGRGAKTAGHRGAGRKKTLI